MVEKKFLHHALIFFRLERTGGVDQHPAGGKEICRVLEQGQLFLPVAGYIFRAPVPADIGMSAGDPGAGTRCVDEDAVKERKIPARKLLQIHFVNDRNISRKKAGEIFLQFSQPVRFRLHRMHLESMPRGKLEQVRSLAAKTGTTVEIRRSRTKRAKQAGGELGSLILHLEKPFGITGNGGDGPLKFGE